MISIFLAILFVSIGITLFYWQHTRASTSNTTTTKKNVADLSDNDDWFQYTGHSEAVLREWVSRLGMFRFYQIPVHGYAENGLELVLQYKDTDDLIALLNQLGVGTIQFDNKPDQPVKGKSYASDEFDAFPSLIRGTQWIKQPGHCVLFDVDVFIWCYEDGLLKMSASPGSYEVTNEHVNAAEMLEKNLGIFRDRLKDPPIDNKYCICPKFHPTFFE